MFSDHHLYVIYTQSLRHMYTTSHVNIHMHTLSHTHRREEHQKNPIYLEFTEIYWYHTLPLLSVFLMTIIMHVKNGVSGYGQSYR